MLIAVWKFASQKNLAIVFACGYYMVAKMLFNITIENRKAYSAYKYKWINPCTAGTSSFLFSLKLNKLRQKDPYSSNYEHSRASNFVLK